MKLETAFPPHIFRLRHKLEANRKEPGLIHILRGRGSLFGS
jgi:hypothetical protein